MLNVGKWVNSLLGRNPSPNGVSSQASLSLGLGDSSLVSKEDEKASSFSVVDDPITGDYISLSVRSIRVGSYKSAPRDKVIFTEKGVRLIVPSLSEPSSSVTLDIPKEDILQFLAHFGKGMPIFFLFTSISSNKSIRDKLQMDHRTGLWLDVASSDETQKRITILPDKINEDVKHILLKNYGEGLLKEIESKEANDILVRSSPKEPSLFRIGGPALSRGQQPPSVKYCTFPPSSQNSVTVSTEDYCVLEDECFLNDVIIDFYTRYLQYKLFSEADRERTHIFSTFFYNRLTSRPKKMKNKPHPVEDNPNLSAAEKRYERVKRWTKKVDLFSKDFVIVPINEHSHWFVAIICYPGELGPTRLDNGEPVEPQELKRNPHRIKMPKQIQKRIVQIGSTTIIPVRTTITATVNGTPEVIKPTLPEEDISDRDEAEASDDDMMDEEPNFPRFNNVFFPPPIQPPPSSNLPQNKEQDSNNTPVNQEEGQKAEPKEGEPNSLESEKSEEPKGEEEVNKSPPQSPKEQKTEETNPQENFPESPEEHVPIRQPCILIFDSLATGSRARVVATLRDYLMCEHKAKKGSERSFTKENIMGHCPKVPQQPNFSDCGIFLLQYVESFFKSPIPNYHLPIKSLRGWFPPEVVRHKRSDIGKIIRDLAQEQNPGKNLPFPNIMFAPPTGSGYTDDEDMEEELGEEEDIGEEEGEEEEAEEEEQGVEEEEGMEGGEEEVAIPSSQAEEEIPSPASPDSTSLNDLPNPLVDYSDSNSPDDTLPDSSGSNSKRTLIDDDEPSSPTHESSKKPKLDSSS